MKKKSYSKLSKNEPENIPVLGQLPPRKIAPNPKTNLNLTKNITITGGQFSRGKSSGYRYVKGFKQFKTDFW